MMSSILKRRKEGSRTKIKSLGDHKEFLKRITKTLYYGQLPSLPCLSLPVTEISCEAWSVPQSGRSVRRLRCDAAAAVARSACVSPCALVLALLYLERLNACNPDYLAMAHPSDLFLVSLMVGSKFLQDDGEDEDVLCSEWAASGGLDLGQLKRLELEFLSAIDWNVFVSEKSFEGGLAWLEKQVALKQSQVHGFCTYSDVVVTCDADQVRVAARVAALACLSAAVGYLAGLLALLASSWLVSQAVLPPSPTSSPKLDTNIIAHPVAFQISSYINYSDTELSDHVIPSSTGIDLPNLSTDVRQQLKTDDGKCCPKWLRYQESVETAKTWYDGGVFLDWESFDTWWSKTSVLNWLYQSSLINPLQRWLEQKYEYGDMYKAESNGGNAQSPSGSGRHSAHCHQEKRNVNQHCIRQWLNLSKLSALVVSVSDR